MIIVYFESSAHAEQIAIFANDELYMTCLPALEAKAKKWRMKVTESYIETKHDGMLAAKSFTSDCF